MRWAGGSENADTGSTSSHSPKMPLFSVIIPAYNRASLIGATLDSVLNQEDRGDVEIIVVDDGSTDGTMQVLNQYSQQHGVRVLQQLNRGPGAARNLGLFAATGEYAAFLDSDDLWFPWTLRIYRQVIEANHRPAFLSGMQREFSDGAELAGTAMHDLDVESFKDYYASSDRWRWFSASSFVIRKDAAIAVKAFDSGWGVSEDADLAMKLGTSPGFVHICSPFTFAYRVHGGNVMNNAGRIFTGISLLIDHEKGGHYPGGVERRRQRQEIICRHARWCSIACAKAGSQEMSWDLYLRTLRWNMRLRRLKYVFGFPATAATCKFKPKRPQG